MAPALPDGPRGRLLAVGLAAALLGLFWIGVAAPLIALHARQAERLEHQRALARRMSTLAAALPELRSQATSGGDASAPAQGGAGLLPVVIGTGADAVAAAVLQERVHAMAAGVGAALASAETLPAEAAGSDGVRRIGLRVAVTASWATLVKLLRAISATTAPLMIVDDLQLRAPDLMRQHSVAMEASFTVLAFRPVAPAQ